MRGVMQGTAAWVWVIKRTSTSLLYCGALSVTTNTSVRLQLTIEADCYPGTHVLWPYRSPARRRRAVRTDQYVPPFHPEMHMHGRADTRTGSVVIDRSGNFFIAGKWKLTGDGSAGQAYTQFQKIQGLQGCRTLTASIGGCTHLLTIPGPVGPDGVGAVQTVGFGQGCVSISFIWDSVACETKEVGWRYRLCGSAV